METKQQPKRKGGKKKCAVEQNSEAVRLEPALPEKGSKPYITGKFVHLSTAPPGAEFIFLMIILCT